MRDKSWLNVGAHFVNNIPRSASGNVEKFKVTSMHNEKPTKLATGAEGNSTPSRPGLHMSEEVLRTIELWQNFLWEYGEGNRSYRAEVP